MCYSEITGGSSGGSSGGPPGVPSSLSKVKMRSSIYIDIGGLILNYVDVSQPGYHYYRYSEYYTDPKRNEESATSA
jgi:hypothetical protein